MEEKKEKVLDFTKLLPVLIKGWKYYIIATIIAIVISLAFVFTIPRYYTCKVMLAPELSGSGDGINSLMSTFGLGSMEQTDDAISPMLYPDLMSSRDFIISLFSVKITTRDNKLSTTYYDYLKKHTDNAWYVKLMGNLTKMIEKRKNMPSPKVGKKLSPAFMPTRDEDEIAQAITGNLKYDYDKKTGVVSVTVKDQDPLVCALIADTVSNRLVEFITEYRTRKARKDLQYSEKIYAQAKAEYEKSDAIYAAAVDGSWDIVNESVKAQIEKLGNDKNLKYQTFTAVSQKLQTAKAKLQEDTPVITTLQGASVPIKPDGPKRVIITAILIVLAYFVTSIILIVKNNKSK